MLTENGTAYGPPATAPRLVTPRVRTAVVRLTGEYAGIEATVRLNLTVRERRAIQSGDEPSIMAGLAALLVAWNIADAAGQPRPITVETLEDLPNELVLELLRLWSAELAAPLAATSTPAPPSPVASG